MTPVGAARARTSEKQILSAAQKTLTHALEEQGLAEEFRHVHSIEHELPFDVGITGFDAPDQDRFLARLEAESGSGASSSHPA